ncbi:hypothetical protein Tco_0526786 [Tanacetum coccineum]
MNVESQSGGKLPVEKNSNWKLILTWEERGFPTSTKLLVISVYAPQELFEKRGLWGYLCSLIVRWDGATVVLGLVDLPLGGYSYTWDHKSASKMSKLDQFLISEAEDLNDDGGYIAAYQTLVMIDGCEVSVGVSATMLARRKRLAEMKQVVKIVKFGSIIPISGSDFVREVSQAPSDVGYPECGVLMQCMEERNNNGAVKANYMGLHTFGRRCTPEGSATTEGETGC